MTRSEIHDHFARRFMTGRSEKVTPEDLERVEKQLKAKLPQSYREFVLEHGSRAAERLHDWLREWDCMDDAIHYFHPPETAVEQTEEWRELKLPENLFAFGSDLLGNLFCVEITGPKEPRRDESAVWFFDHDFQECHELAETFDGWLFAYLDVGVEE
jgi:hypothetical protein